MASTVFSNPHIPVPTTSLVGREEDLARLGELLHRPNVRLVTVLGAGGVGKTRLVIQLAHELDPDELGPVHLVLLAATTDAGAVLPAIARALGVAQLGSVPLDELIIDAIGDSPLVLMMDNVEHVADDLEFLPRLIASCPNLKVLVTSQVMLRLSAEHVFPVEPLPTSSDEEHDLAAASRLFVERARAVRPDLDLTREHIAAIDDICRQIDGLPLAIELAAARTRFLSPIVLRDRLTERLHLLVGGPRDAPERHRTLRATLTWSHDLLLPDERVLFRRLAVFDPSAPLDAVGPVCNAAGDLDGDVEEILASLVDHSLVRILDAPGTGPRVRLLNTIRDFAQEQLALSGEQDAVSAAHADWFARHVIETPSDTWRSGTPELRMWTVRHLPDVDNFSAALTRLHGDGNQLTALRMVVWVVQFWAEIGQLRESSMWTERLMPYAGEGPVELQAHFFRVAAVMSLLDDVLDVADARASRALALAEEDGNPRLIANIMNLLGQIRWRRGDAAEGERLQRDAIATIKRVSDPLGGALFSAQIADSLIEVGELDRAEPLLQEALPIVARARPEALPFLQGAMGYLLLQRGDLDGAAEYLERALDYHLQPPHRLPSLLAGRLVTIAGLAMRRGAHAEGARLLVASLALCNRIGITVDQQSRAELQRVGNLACAALGDERLNAEMAVGKTMSMPEILDLALAVTRLRAVPLPELTMHGAAPDDDDIGLTPREREVLALLAEGLSNPAIAEALFISERTVTTHLSRLYAKLDVSTRSEAIARAIRLGLVDTPAART